MTDGYRILRFDETEHLNEDGSNWNFWKTRIEPNLIGAKLWPYISGEFPRPAVSEAKKLLKWREANAQALATILMNIAPNVQAGLDCSSAKAAWDCLEDRYARTDPITQNLAHTRLQTKKFVDGSTETLPGHIAEL